MIKAGFGLIALAGIAVATPAFAQVHLDAPGVSVGVGERHHYRHYGDRDRVVIRDRGAYAQSRCVKKTIIRSDGSRTTIRRCN